MDLHDAIKDEPEVRRRCRRQDFLTSEEQLAVTLRYLATGKFDRCFSTPPLTLGTGMCVTWNPLCFFAGDSYDAIGSQLGCHKTTVHRVVRGVTEALLRVLGTTYISFPQDLNTLQGSAAAFASVCPSRGYPGHGLPQVVAAMDGTMIPIAAPANAGEMWRNRKGRHAMNVHAVCDHNAKWLDVIVGYSGRCHDTDVLKHTELGRQLFDDDSELATLLKEGSARLGGVDVPFMIIADSAYPCRKFILPALKTPDMRQGAESALDELFNTKHSSTRNVVERGFGQVKNRWRILLRGVSCAVSVATNVVMLCFVLHNFLLAAQAGDAEEAPQAMYEEYRALIEGAQVVPAVAAHRGLRGRRRRQAAQQGPADDLDIGRRVRDAVVQYTSVGVPIGL